MERDPLKSLSFNSRKGQSILRTSNFVNELKGRDRFFLATAVFLIFGMLGPASGLANGVIDTISWTMLFVTTVISGAMAAGIVLALKRPYSLFIVIPLFVYLTTHSVQIASAISGRDEHTVDSITEAVVISPEQFDIIRNKKMIFYALTSVLVGLGWTMFVIVLNNEGRKRGRIESEIKIAKEIQESLLPQGPILLDWCKVYGKTVPAHEVGGDYFDFVPLPGDRLAIVIADVSGHGVGAGIIAAMTKSALYLQLSIDPSPSMLLDRISAALAQVTNKKTFVTCAYLLIDRSGKSVRYATAGHPPVLMKHGANGKISELRTRNLPLGVKKEGQFEEGQISFGPGDSLLLYTDGITESGDRTGKQFEVDGLSRAFADAKVSDDGCVRIIEASRKFGGLIEVGSL